MSARGECATAGNVDDIAVGLGAGDVFGRDVPAGSDLVLDQDGAVVEVRPDLFGDPACDEVRSAARREADDKVNVLRRVGLGERIFSERHHVQCRSRCTQSQTASGQSGHGALHLV